MSNCLFAYPDKTLSGTISTTGTAWNAFFPLNNLGNRLKSFVARSAGITTAHTKFDITLPTATAIQVIAILAHNMSPSASVTISFSAVGVGGFELGYIQNQEVWPQWYPPSTPVSISDQPYWPDTSNSPDYWLVLPSHVVARYIRVEITDTANPAGYVQLGRCFVANAFQPEINLDYGAGIVWKQDVDVSKSYGGVDWFNVKSQGREISGTLANLSEDEGIIHVFDRQRRLGQEGELYFIFDPSDIYGVYKQRAMLCRHATEDPLQYPFFDKTAGSFVLAEVR